MFLVLLYSCSARSVSKPAAAYNEEYQGRPYPKPYPDSGNVLPLAHYNFSTLNRGAPKPRAPSLEIRLFGGFDVRVDGKPMPPLRSRREQWVMALLTLRNERETSREWLASTLWPDNSSEQALFYLRKALSNLRKALGEAAPRVQSPTPRTLRLDLDDAFADVVEFDRAASRSRPAEAVELYKGPVLPDCQEEWATVERGHREQAYFSALENLAREADAASAVRWLRLLASADPYRESTYRDLMQALADCGDRAAVTVIYRELQTRLHDDLNANPSPETVALFKAISEREARAAISPSASRTGPAPRRHLPVPLTDLIGRTVEISEILTWLETRRLVSLVGAGGVGKTRLSIAVAEAAVPLFEHGVWFVDLSPLAEASLIPQITAKSLGVGEERGRPVLETLMEALAFRQLLLVLDNCEHLPGPCAEFVFALLTACPELRILATSRQPLHVAGEQVFRVPSLPVPPADAGDDLEALLQFESVRLFVDRGSRINDQFRLTIKNATDVAEICRQLDGIAHAIEMAAARLRSASVTEIRTRLADRFRLLTSGNRGALPRQHTLRATIDWSYDQLSEPERRLLRHVSVFSSGWTLEAAEALGSQDQPEDTADLLANLVDKSLVVLAPGGEKARYRLLETVRQYAAYRLAELEERPKLRQRHLEYFSGLAERCEPNLRGPSQVQVQDMLEEEMENIRSALDFCLEQRSNTEVGIRMGRALWIFWADRGYAREGSEVLEKLLEQPEIPASEQAADVLNGAGILFFLQSDYAKARTYSVKGLEMSRELGYLKGIGAALNGLGNVSAEVSEYAGARAFYAESFETQLKLGNQRGAATAKFNLGRVAAQQGDFEASKRTMEECLETYRSMEDKFGFSRALYYLSIACFGQDDFVASKRLAEESAESARELGNSQGIADSLNLVGLSAAQLHDYASARTAHEQSLAAQRELGNKWGIATSLVNLGAVVKETFGRAAAVPLIKESLEMFRELGDVRGISEAIDTFAGLIEEDGALSARLWGAADAMRSASSIRLPPAGIDILERNMTPVRLAIGEDAFAACYAEGRTIPRENAIELALKHHFVTPKNIAPSNHQPSSELTRP